MVGNETSFSAPVSRRKRLQRLDGVDLGELAARRLAVEPDTGSAPAPPRRAHARCACRRSRSSFFTAFSSATGSLPRTGLPPAAMIMRLSASAPVAASMAIAALLSASRFSCDAELVGLGDVGVALEMIARAVRELARVDEHGRPAVLRHQRVGERQRRVRDVGAADVERPGHRVRIGHHQRVGAQLGDLVADARELRRLGVAGEFQVVHRRPVRAAGQGAPATPHRSGCSRPRPAPRRPWRRRPPAAPLPPKCAATGRIRGGRRASAPAPARFPAAARPATPPSRRL